MMTSKHWYLGVALVTAAILFHALFPRYEVRTFATVYPIRVDRWTGRVSRAVRSDLPAGQRDELADFLSQQK